MHIWFLGIEKKITSLQSTPPEESENKEVPKSKTHVPRRREGGQEPLSKLGVQGERGGRWKEEKGKREEEN